MLAKTPKTHALDLDAIKHDLADAEAKLNALNDSERSALSSSSAFVGWRTERDAASAEVDRLSRLAERIVADAAEKAAREQHAALQKRVDAQRAANQKLAERIRMEGGKAVEVLLGLVKDVAEAAVVDDELNAQIGRDEQIVGADYLARSRQATPREIISEEQIALWVFAETGELIGNQDQVVPHSSDHGSIQGARHGIPAVSRKFRKTEFYPAQGSDHGEPLWSALQLPLMDGPGYAWGEQKHHAPALVLEALAELKSGDADGRQTMTELTPLEPFKPEYRR